MTGHINSNEVILSPEVDVHLLGVVRVSIAGRELAINHQEQLLAARLLAEPGKWISVEELSDGFWEDDTDAGRNERERIYDVVRKLRRAMDAAQNGAGHAVIKSRTGMYRAAVRLEQVDLHRFDTLWREAKANEREGEWLPAVQKYESAMRLGGDDLVRPAQPLAGLRGEWARRVRTGIESRQLRTLLDRLDLGLRLGQHDDLVPVLAEVGSIHPDNGRATSLHMIALFRAGRQVDALRAYDAHEQKLAETGLLPDRDIEELRQRVLVGDPTLKAPRTVTGTPPSDSDGGEAQEATAPGRMPDPQTVQHKPADRPVKYSTKIGRISASGINAIGSGAGVHLHGETT